MSFDSNVEHNTKYPSFTRVVIITHSLNRHFLRHPIFVELKKNSQSIPLRTTFLAADQTEPCNSSDLLKHYQTFVTIYGTFQLCFEYQKYIRTYNPL